MAPISKYSPQKLNECFYFDESDINRPRRGLKKLWDLFFLSSFSMPVLMRISQYYYNKGWLGRLIGSVFRRLNEILNNFEHGSNPNIEKGIVFHHNAVCITSDTVIESGVHIYRNVTFGIKNGKAPYIKSKAKIASHSIILGGVVVGKKSIVSPGAVVLNDVPDGKVVGGVPAKVIADVTEKNYNF